MIAAANEGDDLEIVAVLDRHVRQRRSRYHHHIAFYRDLVGIEAQLGRQFRDRDSLAYATMLAVHADRQSVSDHGSCSLCALELTAI